MKPGTLERAARQWAQESPYMPKAAELIGLCRKLDRPNADLVATCEQANASMATRGVNDWRIRQGLDPVRWIIRDGQVAIES